MSGRGLVSIEWEHSIVGIYYNIYGGRGLVTIVSGRGFGWYSLLCVVVVFVVSVAVVSHCSRDDKEPKTSRFTLLHHYCRPGGFHYQPSSCRRR